MYAVRDYIQQLAKKALKVKCFDKYLLADYIAGKPVQTTSWDIS